MGAILSGLLAGMLTVYGVYENRRHLRHLERIPHRVHVNGTRGKSSVTRLIAGGVRAGGLRTMAKTTGTDARLLYPDGHESPVYRVGRPNLIEQTRIVRRAVEERVEVLVIECMAVQPELQPVAELRLVKSTVGVITNARADHLDGMGPTVDDVALTLAQTLPMHGAAFTAERERAHLLARVAAARGSTLVVTDPAAVHEGDLAGFGYIEHAENVALALAVCAHFGVPRETAQSSKAKAGDGDDAVTPLDDVDVSYHGIAFDGDVRWRIVRGPRFQLEGVFTAQTEGRTYDSDRIADRYHYGRVDQRWRIEPSLRLSWRRRWGARLAYLYEHNEARLGAAASASADAGTYTENRVGFSIDWNGQVWHSHTSTEPE